MKHGIRKLLPLTGICLLLLSSMAHAQGQGNQKDVFKGKLFPPNIILEHQDELNLSKEQFTAIRAAVVEVQSNVAEHEWDLREAYQRVLSELDETPIDENAVLDNVEAALRAENQVKKMQVSLLIRLRNLLTDEQVAYLRSVNGR
jgi:Spy/CpxP family protein refolding chaperone